MLRYRECLSYSAKRLQTNLCHFIVRLQVAINRNRFLDVCMQSPSYGPEAKGLSSRRRLLPSRIVTDLEDRRGPRSHPKAAYEGSTTTESRVRDVKEYIYSMGVRNENCVNLPQSFLRPPFLRCGVKRFTTLGVQRRPEASGSSA